MCGLLAEIFARISGSSPGYYLQIIEISNRIGLSPQTDLAGIFERVVRCFDLLRAVVVTNELVAHSLHAQLVPFAGRDLEIRSRELTAAAVNDVVQPVVILQGVRSDDVIVI